MNETFEILPWTQQIQKTVQNTTGCHFAKNLAFGNQNDSLTPLCLWDPAPLSLPRKYGNLNPLASCNTNGLYCALE